MAATPTSEGRRSRLAEQRKRLPDGPGVYLFRDGRGQGHLRRQGEVDQEARRQPLLQSGDARRVRDGRRDRVGRVPPRRLRGRGAAHRAELHQAVPPAVQHPPARRQVLSVHRDLDGRGLPARLLHARAPPARAASTSARTRTPSASAARSTCSARSSCSARARASSPAGAPARRASTTTSSAAGRPASATSTRRSTARRSTASSRSSRGRYREIERDLERRMKAGRRGARVRAGRARAQPPARGALAARAPARRQRVGRHARHRRRRRRRHRRQRPGLPGPRRRPLRPPVLLPRQRRRAGTGEVAVEFMLQYYGRRDLDPGADRRPAGDRGGPRGRSAEALASAAAAGSSCAPPSAATSAACSSSPSATPSSRSTRRSSRPSAAASSASRRSTASSRRSGSTRCRCASSASTSRT